MLKFLKPFTGLMIVLSLGFGFPGPALADLTQDILSGIEKKYANKAFSSDFEQTTRLTVLDVTEIATGKARFSHPGKMRWSYESPDHHEIITNGHTLWIYRPQENQVMQGRADLFLKAGTGGAFLSDISRIRKDFTISLGKSTENFAELLLVPKQETPDLSSIRMTVDLPSHEIHVVVTKNPYGDTTRFFFTNIRFTPLDPRAFDFIIPGDAEVIEMN